MTRHAIWVLGFLAAACGDPAGPKLIPAGEALLRLAPVPPDVLNVQACITNSQGSTCFDLVIESEVALGAVPAPADVNQIDAYAFGASGLLYQGSGVIVVEAGSLTPAVIPMACVSPECDPASGTIGIVAYFPEREQEPNNDAPSAQLLTQTLIPAALRIVYSANGLVSSAVDEDYFAFTALQGNQLTFGSVGTEFDACVVVFDDLLSVLNVTCDPIPAQVVAPYSGTYYLYVATINTTTGRYTAFVEEQF